MNSVYIVMSSRTISPYESIERIFSDQESAEEYAAYLKRIDDSFDDQYEYYVVEHKIFDHFDEMEEIR